MSPTSAVLVLVAIAWSASCAVDSNATEARHVESSFDPAACQGEATIQRCDFHEDTVWYRDVFRLSVGDDVEVEVEDACPESRKIEVRFHGQSGFDLVLDLESVRVHAASRSDLHVAGRATDRIVIDDARIVISPRTGPPRHLLFLVEARSLESGKVHDLLGQIPLP